MDYKILELLKVSDKDCQKIAKFIIELMNNKQEDVLVIITNKKSIIVGN